MVVIVACDYTGDYVCMAVIQGPYFIGKISFVIASTVLPYMGGDFAE
jgi:hypothetical protein